MRTFEYSSRFTLIIRGSAGSVTLFDEILRGAEAEGSRRSCWINTWNPFIRKVAPGDREEGGHEKKRETQSERNTWESAQPFSCSSSSSTGQGSWKRRDYQGAGAVLAWAATAHSCTARYTALLKHWTWFSHTHTLAYTLLSLSFAKICYDV